jgi:hypothetical protein
MHSFSLQKKDNYMIKFKWYSINKAQWDDVELEDTFEGLYVFKAKILMHNYSIDTNVGVPDIISGLLDGTIKDIEIQHGNDTVHFNKIFKYIFKEIR